MLAVALLMSGFIGWTSRMANLKEAADLAVRAAELDGSDRRCALKADLERRLGLLRSATAA
jgi:hypothetical protein